MFPGFDRIKLFAFDLDGTLYPNVSLLIRRLWERHQDLVLARHPTPWTGRVISSNPRTATQAWCRPTARMHHAVEALYGMDPRGYLSHLYDIDLDGFIADPAVPALMAQLPGRKVVWTNSIHDFANRLLPRLGHAPDLPILGVDDMPGLKGKPFLSAYQALLQYSGLQPDEICLVEDTAANLGPARGLGIRTAFLHGHDGVPRAHRDTDISCCGITDFLRRAVEPIPRRH